MYGNDWINFGVFFFFISKTSIFEHVVILQVDITAKQNSMNFAYDFLHYCTLQYSPITDCSTRVLLVGVSQNQNQTEVIFLTNQNRRKQHNERGIPKQTHITGVKRGKIACERS